MRIISADGYNSMPYQTSGLYLRFDCEEECYSCLERNCGFRIMVAGATYAIMGEYKTKKRALEVLRECTKAFSGLHPVNVYKFPEE